METQNTTEATPCECNDNRVTVEDVINEIVEVSSSTVDLVGKPHTVTAAKLNNGFTVVETSTCVDVDNYDIAIGESVNLNKIHDKVWLLLGYTLQTRLHEDQCPVSKNNVLTTTRDLLVSAVGQDSLSDDELMTAVNQIDNVLDTSACCPTEVDYQTRVVAELEQLDAKYTALNEFLHKESVEQTVSNEELDRLTTQHSVMGKYVSILRIRIANFPKKG